MLENVSQNTHQQDSITFQIKNKYGHIVNYNQLINYKINKISYKTRERTAIFVTAGNYSLSIKQ